MLQRKVIVLSYSSKRLKINVFLVGNISPFRKFISDVQLSYYLLHFFLFLKHIFTQSISSQLICYFWEVLRINKAQKHDSFIWKHVGSFLTTTKKGPSSVCVGLSLCRASLKRIREVRGKKIHSHHQLLFSFG